MSFSIPENKIIEKKDSVPTIRMLLYGAAMIGKTSLINTFPSPLVFNTDGNTEPLDREAIKLNELQIEVPIRKGQPETRVLSKWETTGEWIYKLVNNKKDLIEKGYKTIVIDVMDHMYLWATEYILAKKGLQHEQDANDFGKTNSLIRREFLKVIEKLRELENDFNLVYISHEEVKKIDNNGIKVDTIIPSFTIKAIKEIEKVVNITGRLSIDKDGNRVLGVSPTATTVAGNRLDMKEDIVSPTYDKIINNIKGKI